MDLSLRDRLILRLASPVDRRRHLFDKIRVAVQEHGSIRDEAGFQAAVEYAAQLGMESAPAASARGLWERGASGVGAVLNQSFRGAKSEAYYCQQILRQGLSMRSVAAPAATLYPFLPPEVDAAAREELLAAAIGSKDPKAAQILLGHGVPVDSREPAGLPPFLVLMSLMAEPNCPDFLDWLVVAEKMLAAGYDVNQVYVTPPCRDIPAVRTRPALQAIMAGNVQVLQLLDKHGCDFSVVESKGSMLHRLIIQHASIHPSEFNACLKFLLRKRVPIDEVHPETGHTPLLAAAATGSVNLVRELLVAGALPAGPSASGQTLLHVLPKLGSPAELGDILAFYSWKHWETPDHAGLTPRENFASHAGLRGDVADAWRAYLHDAVMARLVAPELAPVQGATPETTPRRHRL